jgi:hypothetical protein
MVLTVPDRRVGRCLGPERNGVSPREGGEGGPCPPDKEQDKSQLPARKEATYVEQEEEEPGMTKEDPACTE